MDVTLQVCVVCPLVNELIVKESMSACVLTTHHFLPAVCISRARCIRSSFCYEVGASRLPRTVSAVVLLTMESEVLPRNCWSTCCAVPRLRNALYWRVLCAQHTRLVFSTLIVENTHTWIEVRSFRWYQICHVHASTQYIYLLQQQLLCDSSGWTCRLVSMLTLCPLRTTSTPRARPSPASSLPPAHTACTVTPMLVQA